MGWPTGILQCTKYVNVIARMRLGEYDRDIARAGAMGRPKSAQLRVLALEQGWLDLSRPLPSNDVLESLLQLLKSTQPSQSLAKPFANQICTWADEGIQITTIHQALVERYGFTGSYDSARRLLKTHQKSAPVGSVFLDHPAAKTAQIDFGAGPVITDVHTGEVMKTWFFVVTLPCSKHMYAELVTNQRVETCLSCHRRAFEHVGGTTLKMVVDNPKYDIARVCYESKVLRA